MIRYILKRFLIAVPLLIAISFITFLLIQLSPGDYFDRMKMDPHFSEETINEFKAKYHLDESPPIQFIFWLKNLAKLDFGYSFSQNSDVWSVLKSRIFNTFILSVTAIFFTWLIAIPIGTICAVKQYTWTDKIFSSISFMGMSVPNFFLALLLLYCASIIGGWPVGGMHSAHYYDFSFFGKIIDVLKHMVIPVMVIGFGSVAGLQRLMRGNMLEVLRAQYITTARAKGLPERRIIYRHALKNAVNPMITIFGFQLSGLLGGAALTEIICSWPGMGSLLLEATRSQDIYLVMGDIFMAGVLLITGNLIADILLAFVDPRIRVS